MIAPKVTDWLTDWLTYLVTDWLTYWPTDLTTHIDTNWGGGGREQKLSNWCRLIPVLVDQSSNQLGTTVGLPIVTIGLVGVFLEVPIQVGLLAKAPVAESALKRPLLVVDIPDVPLQIGRYAEGSATVAARVGLLARVGPQVSG